MIRLLLWEGAPLAPMAHRWARTIAGDINKDNSVDIRSNIDIIRCFTAYTSILRVKGDDTGHLP